MTQKPFMMKIFSSNENWPFGFWIILQSHLRLHKIPDPNGLPTLLPHAWWNNTTERWINEWVKTWLSHGRKTNRRKTNNKRQKWKTKKFYSEPFQLYVMLWPVQTCIYFYPKRPLQYYNNADQWLRQLSLYLFIWWPWKGPIGGALRQV